MKILHLLSETTPESCAMKVVRSLALANIDQIVVLPEKSPCTRQLRKADIPTDGSPFERPFDWLRKRRLTAVIAEQKPDLVHCWSRRDAQLLDRRVMRHTHTLGWIGVACSPYHYESCEHLVAVTQTIADDLIRNGSVPAYTHNIPSFPDVVPSSPIDRISLSTPRDAKILLTLSRLRPQKGLTTLIDALPLLPECVLWMAGEGPSKREIEFRARQAGVLDRVRFLGWRDDRFALLRAADVCVLPSQHEPLGSVIHEAWAAGVPVAACACDGAKAQIKDGTTGLLSPVGEAQALSENIRKILQDETLRRRLVAQGYAAYIKDYTREAVMHRWMKLYASIVQSPAQAELPTAKAA